MLLVIALEAAIPLWVSKLEGTPDATLERIARNAGEVLACHGDVLQFKSPTKRKRKPGSETKSTAEVFNTVARGLAAAQLLGHDTDWVLRRIQEVDTI